MKQTLFYLLALAATVSAQLKPAAKTDGSNIEPGPFKTALALSKSDVGLGNVTNTSDANKPVSTATQTALDAKFDSINFAFESYSYKHGLGVAAKARLAAAIAFMRTNSIFPDDMLLLRDAYQSSATSPASFMGVVGITGGTPTKTQYGLTTNGTSQYAIFALPDALTACTIISDQEGYDSGQPSPAYGGIFSLGPAAGIATAGGHVLNFGPSGEYAGNVFSRDLAGSATFTDSTPDNGSNYQIGAFLGDPQVIGYATDNTNPTIKLGVDGNFSVVDSTGNYKSGDVVNRLTLGARNWNNATDFGAYTKMQFGTVLIYRRVLSAGEFALATKACHILEPRQTVFCVQGDSISSKRSGTTVNVSAGTNLSSDNWSAQLIQANAGIRPNVRLVNKAVNGTIASYGSGNFATDIAPFAPNGITYTYGVYGQGYGTNDLLFGSLTGAQIYANRKAATDAAKALGFTTFHLTCVAALSKNNPATGATITGYSGPQETRRNDLNSSLTTGKANNEFDYLVDLRRLAALTEPVGAFYYDGIHPNQKGEELMMEETAATVPIPGVNLPRCTVAPTISGTTTLTTSTGTWVNSPTSYSYQWYAVTPGASGTVSAIGGATSASWTVSGQTGNRVYCKVTGTNYYGSQKRSTDLTPTL